MKGDLVPLALTDRRIAVLKTIAATIPWRLRAQLTQRLASLPPLLRRCQVSIESECVAIQVIEGKLTRPPCSIINAVRSALDTTLPIFVEERV
jgi:hypothetical protein